MILGEEQLRNTSLRKQQSKNFSKGKFKYPNETPIDYSFKALLPVMLDYIKGNPNKRPTETLRVQQISTLTSKSNKASVTWLGHSTSIIQLDGKLLLLDPNFEAYSSPFKLGGKRYSKELPIEVHNLPELDAVLISHDHYDHLDSKTIKKLTNKVKMFLVPLGIGSHLQRWGIKAEQIIELDWWEEAEFFGLTFRCTPAKHSSGRGMFDHNATLWCSWIIEGKDEKIFFGGDSGYGPHFKEIGDKYGPFDVTLLEAGQYDNSGWWPLHMLPEETVQAHIELQGKTLLPIHWGAFTLAIHDWDEPIERVLKAAVERNVIVAAPRIGENVDIGSTQGPVFPWWRIYKGGCDRL
ncbi:hypothetical protein CEQ21_04880 [Niallia circulans]|uniref:Metallo-beta-lactamase domain-containing protein n=1 Tax=Niallia circulans TaxID=1397 RepID=A0A553STI0_NIACI|nr:MBL fold metallo-hydrolase [Niallia circulans]TRZ40274.1 hypothetical protein CEQ21_04880 [Niallia circulans]